MNAQGNSPQVPCLAVGLNGLVTWINVDPGANTLVGTGSHCKIQLEGDGVSSLHCILAFTEDGRLEVRDWNTGCTFVNGQPIQEATELREVDLLTVGDYQIKAALTSAGVAALMEAEQTQVEPCPTRPEVCVESNVPAQTTTPVVVEVVEAVDEVQHEVSTEHQVENIPAAAAPEAAEKVSVEVEAAEPEFQQADSFDHEEVSSVETAQEPQAEIPADVEVAPVLSDVVSESMAEPEGVEPECVEPESVEPESVEPESTVEPLAETHADPESDQQPADSIETETETETEAEAEVIEVAAAPEAAVEAEVAVEIAEDAPKAAPVTPVEVTTLSDDVAVEPAPEMEEVEA